MKLHGNTGNGKSPAKPFILGLILLLIMGTQTVLSQVMNRNRYGAGNPGPTAQSQRQEEPKTAEEMIDIMMPKISESLKLNDFDEAVMRAILLKYMKKRLELRILELPDERTREILGQILKEEDAELRSSLSLEVYEGYKKISEEGLNWKKKEEKEKKKKERKRRRNKKEQEEESER